MDLQGWLPLLLSRKEIIISHIGKFYPPYPQCSNEEIVVMDKAGKIITANRECQTKMKY